MIKVYKKFTDLLDVPTLAGNTLKVWRVKSDETGMELASISSYTLPIASGSVLGGIKVGTRLSIDGDGILSADVQGGVTAHASLTQLDYASAGHTGFQATIGQALESTNTPTFGGMTFTGNLGANSIVNGTFAADTNWTKGAGWTIAGGVAVATGTTGNLSETVTTVVAGKYYELSWDVVVTSGTYQITAGGNTSATFTASGTGNEWYFYSISTAVVTFDGVTSFTGTIDNVTLKEVSAQVAVNHTILTSTVSTQPVIIKALLNDAIGNQRALHLVYQTNKAAGNDTGLQIDMLDTSSPGTSYLINAQSGGASRFTVDNAGNLGSISTVGFGGTGLLSAIGLIGFTINSGTITSYYIFRNPNNANTLTTGTIDYLSIAPLYNQASGTAVNTDLKINRTETAIGSGIQRLISAGTGGGSYTEKWGVDNLGRPNHTVVNTTITNAYVVNGGQAATTSNTGWLSVLVNGVQSWVPYWTNATP